MPDHRVGHNTVAATNTSASATIIANSTGWTTSTRCSSGAARVLAHTTSRTDQPVHGRSACVTLVKGAREAAVALVELGAHAGVLGALAGQDEHDFAGRLGQMVVLAQPGVGLAGAQGLQGVQQILAGVLGVGGLGDAGPVGVLGAGAGQAVGHIGQLQIRVAGQVLIKPLGLRGQRRGATRRDRPNPQRGPANRIRR